MSIGEIMALPVGDLAEHDAHLWLWTTNRYLRIAFDIVEAWGFRFGQIVVWAKKPQSGVLGGAFSPNVEFVLFSRRGNLAHLDRQPSQWYQWPRQAGRHSAKPEAFLDLVERVSPGPYLELFARRNRLGWDTWGNEALEHVSVLSG
jgi:N6-adenosine-specific RNA methylase IME4